jgi:hypothetical protein
LLLLPFLGALCVLGGASSAYNDGRLFPAGSAAQLHALNPKGSLSIQSLEWEVTTVPTTKQITVFLENKPGRLANVLSSLAREKVNLAALSVMDRHEHSVLRIVPDDPAHANRVLHGQNIPFTETEVLLVELRNQPGALAHVCEVLAGDHIGIDYAYCSSGGRNGKVFGIFKVSNTEKATRILGESPNNIGRRRVEPRPVRNQRTYQAPGAGKR